MHSFKRNQVEEAISGVVESRAKLPSRELRTRIKRLLETDRLLGRASRSSDPERANYAFYSDDAPGSGVEVWFSGYEAFAILNGLQLMVHGWPQSFAVSVMRRVRPQLEKEHARILQQDPIKLFDQSEIRRRASPGDMAFSNTDPVLLTIVTKSGTASSDAELLACSVSRGPDAALKFFQAQGGSRRGGILTMSDVVGVAHALSDALTRTMPQHRGRS
jgi:hypothetical protein